MRFGNIKYGDISILQLFHFEFSTGFGHRRFPEQTKSKRKYYKTINDYITLSCLHMTSLAFDVTG